MTLFTPEGILLGHRSMNHDIMAKFPGVGENNPERDVYFLNFLETNKPAE